MSVKNTKKTVELSIFIKGIRIEMMFKKNDHESK